MDDDYNFTFERQVDSSERTDSDAGGGNSFVFYDGPPGKKKEFYLPGEEKKPRKPVDFGEPVELELSESALGNTAAGETGVVKDEPTAPKPSNVGRHLDIEV